MPPMRPTAAGDSAPRPSARTACGSNASGAIDKGSRAADQRVLPRPPHAAKPDLAEVEPQRAGERPRVAAPVAVHDERSPRRDQRNHGEELRQRDLRLVGVRDVVHHVVELPSGLCEPGDGGLGVRADDLQLADTIEPEPLAGNTHDERRLMVHGEILSIYPLNGDWRPVRREYWWKALDAVELPRRPSALLVGLGGGGARRRRAPSTSIHGAPVSSRR